MNGPVSSASKSSWGIHGEFSSPNPTPWVLISGKNSPRNVLFQAGVKVITPLGDSAVKVKDTGLCAPEKDI